MHIRQPGIQHEDALDRRLALLGDELAWLRPELDDRPPLAVRPGAPGARADNARVASDSEPPWWQEHTRVSGARLDVLPQASSAPGSMAAGARPNPGSLDVSTPGRHAARRASARPLPDDEQPWSRPGDGFRATARLLLGPAQLTVVAVVVVFALAVTCWWLARGRPDSTVALQAAPAAGLTPAPVAAGGSGGGSATDAGPAQPAVTTARAVPASSVPSSSTASGPTTGSVTVDVAGKVRSPGVQVLTAGARINDALAAAGGLRPGVDVTGLNLAQVLVDGQQILVGVAGGDQTSAVSGSGAPTGATGTTGSTGSASSPAGSAGEVSVVDLNTATAEQLDSLPDVGPVTAQSILSWRDAHGGFTSVDELLEVDGIGQVTLGKLAPYVTV